MKDLLIIDGYNVLHRWGLFAENSLLNLEMKRERLLEHMVLFQDMEGVNVILVFDGAQGRFRSDSLERKKGIEIIFSSRGQTADSVIEKRVHKEAKRRKVTVVSSDRQVALLSEGYGAVRWSAERMAQELAEVAQNMHNDIELRKLKQRHVFKIEDR